MTRNQIRMVQVIVGCLAGGVTAAVTAIEGGASLGLAIALGFAAFGGTFATAALVPRTAEAKGDGGPKTADGKPMRYNVPSVALALCLVPLLGACGLTQQQRIQTARDATCVASVSTLEAVEVAAPLCESDQCLDRLDQAREAAMQTAILACEERAEGEGEGNAETISRENRPLSQLRHAGRRVSIGAACGGRGGSAQRYRGQRLRAEPHGNLLQSRRARRGANAWSLELAAAGVAGEERT